MYTNNTASILIYMGYVSEVDFSVSSISGTISLAWYHTDTKPTEQDVLDNEENWLNSTKQSDMLSQGAFMTAEDDARLSVSADGKIVDRTAHNTWMQTLYSDTDSSVISTPKPPANERQEYEIYGEDVDPFKFTRFLGAWGWQWRMDLTRSSANNLALYIQDSNGNYLYTTGALIDNGDGTYYAECPAGQADATPEDVYFHWILGAGRISSDFVYAGTDESLSGVVRSDETYD